MQKDMQEKLRRELEMDDETVLSGICEIGGFCFKIPCYSRITLMGDDSGSGKTYFIRKLKYYLENDNSIDGNMIFTDGFDRNKLHAMLHPNELDRVDDNLVGHFFIIDRFNLFTSEQADKAQKLADNKCIFLLFTRHYAPMHARSRSATLHLHVDCIDDMEYFRFGLE